MGPSENCALLTQLEPHCAGLRREHRIEGIDAAIEASAVGLVILVWRNSPVEDMHAGRRGPDDAAMFATSTELQAAAAKALRKDNRAWGLLDFEDYLLDRDRPWPVTAGRNLQDLGYGHLGTYQRHVKEQINVLLGLTKHVCVEDPLATYLIPRAIMYGRFHKGMPGWDSSWTGSGCCFPTLGIVDGAIRTTVTKPFVTCRAGCRSKTSSVLFAPVRRACRTRCCSG
ncbi:hypothetical protein [Kribbella solani]|uniref:hypothetical protein n=1 Tax=Kribbella solani TaxID=236067 RepID=UPI0029AFAAEA|nr:hypothetical protein [Kribbella solani]MDX2974693.1 hypothetical protein [Kribbella solani]